MADAEASARLQVIIDVVGNVGRQLDKVAADLKGVSAEAQRLSATTTQVGAKGAQSINRLSAALKNAEAGFKRLNQVGQQFTATGARIATIGAGLAAGGLFPVKVASDFEGALKGVVAVTAGARENYAALADEAKRLGRETQFTAVQSAEGFRLLGQAGLNATEAIEALEPALLLASAAGISVAEAADLSTNVLKGFALETSDLTRVTDVLANTATSANTTILDLGQALSFAAAPAEAVGVSVDIAAAAVGVLGDAGIKATRAGTGLRAILSRLADPKIVATLGELNIEVERTADGSLDLIETFRNIGERVAAQQFGLAEATQVFGRNFNSTALVLAKNVDNLERLSRANEQADGTAKEVSRTLLEGLGGALVELRAAIEGLLIEIGEPLLGPLENLVDSFKDVIVQITQWAEANPQLASTLAALAGGAGVFLAVVGTLTIALGGLIQAVAFGATGFIKLGQGLQFVVTWARAANINLLVTNVTVRGLAASFGVLLAAVTAFIAGWQIGRILNDLQVWEDSTSTVGDVVQFTFGNIDRGITRLLIGYERLKIKAQEFLGLNVDDNIAELRRLENELEIIDRTLDAIVREGETRGQQPVTIPVEPQVQVRGFDENLRIVEQRSRETGQRAGQAVDENVTPAWARGAEFVGLFVDETKKAEQAVTEFETLVVEVGGELREFKFPVQPTEETKRAADAAKTLKQETQSVAQTLPEWAQGSEFVGVFTDAANEAVEKTREFEDVVVQVGDKVQTFQVPANLADGLDQAKTQADGAAISIENVGQIIEQISGSGLQIRVVLENFDQVSAQIADLVKPETKNVTVRVTEQREAASGGLIDRMLAAGGKLAGYGGGDRIRALLEAGEYVVRKEAVKKYGVGLFHALNTMRYGVERMPGIIASRLGGLIPNIPQPRYAYQTGGRVTGGVDVRDFGTVTLNVGGRGFPVMSSQDTINELKTVLKRESLTRSN